MLKILLKRSMHPMRCAALHRVEHSTFYRCCALYDADLTHAKVSALKLERERKKTLLPEDQNPAEHVLGLRTRVVFHFSSAVERTNHLMIISQSFFLSKRGKTYRHELLGCLPVHYAEIRRAIRFMHGTYSTLHHPAGL